VKGTTFFQAAAGTIILKVRAMHSLYSAITWILSFICWAFFANITLAQSDDARVVFKAPENAKKANYFLTGKVIFLETGEPLSGVSVHIDGFFTGINTDANGQYFVSLDSGRHRIAFRHFGKQGRIYQVDLYGDGVLDTELTGLQFELDMFTLRSEEREMIVKSPITGVTKMNIDEIKLVPTLLGEPDVFNVLQAMPGVTSVGEGSAGLNIRGGQADQNLILMNEAIVLSNSHALGFLSSFNGDVVQNFTLYKGAVPSNFGGRSASALNIEMRKGDKETWKGSVSLGTGVSKLMLEGPLVKEKTGLIAAARRSNANWLLRQVDNTDVRASDIRFHDLYLGVSHQFSQKNNLDLNILNTGDYFKFSNNFGFEWNNFVSSITSRNLITDDFSLVGMAAYGSFNNGFFEPSDIDPSIVKNGLYYYQGKISGLWTLEKAVLQGGIEGVMYQMRPEKLEPFTPQSGIQPQSIQKQRGLEWAPFVSAEWNPNENFTLMAGLRYSMYQQMAPDTVFQYEAGLPISTTTQTGYEFFENGKIVGYQGLEPRFSLRYTWDEVHTFKAGFAVLNQYLQTISNATGPTPIDLWQLSTTYILPQRSQNYSVGYFRSLKENKWTASLEGFFRTTKNQLEYRDFADLFLNRQLETELIQGQGMAFGAELMIQKNIGSVTGWLAYTFSRSLVRTVSPFREIQVNGGDWFPTNFDRPHILSLVTSFHLGNQRDFNINLNYSSGRPVTGLYSNYVVGGVFVPNFGDRNQFRIPNYFRIDLSYLANGPVRAWDDKINISVYNLLGRRNAYSVFFQRDGQLQRLVPYQLAILGAAFPSITYTVNFSSK
jgi:hypothetical protein